MLSFGLAALVLFALRPEIGVLLPVIAAIFRELGLLASLVYSARWRPGLSFDAQALRQILSFALHFTGSRAVTYINTKIAYFFIFVPLGATAQAYYTLAERLTLQPLTRLATTIQRVSFPSFSTVQNDDETLRTGYMRGVQGLMLAMGPVLAGMFVFAPEIEALIGRGPIATILRLLAAATFLKVVGTMVGFMWKPDPADVQQKILLIAAVLATIFGDMNFWFNMQPFYDIENLNTYPSVNPASETGQRLMDAGRVSIVILLSISRVKASFAGGIWDPTVLSLIPLITPTTIPTKNSVS